MNWSTSGFPVLHHLPELAQTYVHWVSDAIQPSCPLSFPSPPAFILSQHQGLSNELALHIRWPNYWNFTFSISPSNEYSGLISFRIDALTSLQSRGLSRVFSSTTTQKHQFFGVQLSLWSSSHMTTGKTIALTRRNFVDKVMSLLFNMLLKFVIAFLPRSKRLLISWLQSPSSAILETKKIKSATVSTFYPSICHEVLGLDVIIPIFWMLSFKAAFLLSAFTLIKRFFGSFPLSAMRVVLSAYLRLLIFLPAILIPACNSSSLALHIVYST